MSVVWPLVWLKNQEYHWQHWQPRWQQTCSGAAIRCQSIWRELGRGRGVEWVDCAAQVEPAAQQLEEHAETTGSNGRIIIDSV